MSDSAPEERIRAPWELQEGWQHLARCRGSDASLFFSPTYLEKRDVRADREAKARAICAECAVKRDCLDFALSTREPHGIWGGFNEIERRAILARRVG
ncbi:MAG: WhiB family transcriptional regulator [Actinobacteria bacterium]|nr:WhiB family transcriptional regulator [Actinomycetota bacterium]